MEPKPCELTFDLGLAAYSLTNYAHISLFFFFFLMTAKQLRMTGRHSLGWSFLATMMMGAALEIAQGLSGNHHCKTVDLIPDSVGAFLGFVVVFLAGNVAVARRVRGNDNEHHGRANETAG